MKNLNYIIYISIALWESFFFFLWINFFAGCIKNSITCHHFHDWFAGYCPPSNHLGRHPLNCTTDFCIGLILHIKYWQKKKIWKFLFGYIWRASYEVEIFLHKTSGILKNEMCLLFFLKGETPTSFFLLVFPAGALILGNALKVECSQNKRTLGTLLGRHRFQKCLIPWALLYTSVSFWFLMCFCVCYIFTS